MLAERSSVSDFHEPDMENQVREEVKFFSLRAMKILAVPFFCGSYYGYNFLFVPVFFQMRVMGMDCAAYNGGRDACESLPYSDCRWYSNSSNGGYCGWTDVTCRVLYPNSGIFGGDEESARAGCLRDHRCTWKYGSQKCSNPVGYDSIRHGIFAGALTGGCALGSTIGGRIATTLGTKLTFLVFGILAMACSLIYHVSIASDDFWLLIPARVAMGMTVGVTAVACALYVDQNAPSELKRSIGSCFMVCVCFGSFLAGLTGLVLGQTISTSHEGDQHLMMRLQGVGAVSSALSLAVVFLGVLIPETRVTFTGVYTGDKGEIEADPNEYSFTQMIPRILISMTVCGAAQLTGYRGLSNYAPTIFGNLGVAPFVGTFLLMALALFGGLCSIRASFYFTPRQLFIFSTFCCSVTCLCCCGIVVFPGVASDQVRMIVALTGSLVFVWAYQFGLGPYFFVLVQDVFPLSFRPRGASIAHSLVFGLNLIVTVSYPLATEGISGGPSGDQNFGQSIVFIFFGIAGFLCFLAEYFFLFPWEDDRSSSRSITDEEELAPKKHLN